MTAKVNVLKQVAALPGLSPTVLNKMWKELFDADPPNCDKRSMIKQLAYRLQELAYGGLPTQVGGQMKTLARNEALIGQASTKQNAMPVAGTRLLREWRGVQHSVTVLAGGFEYQGRPFRSLSAVAKAITGTQWNGPLFFGIRRNNAGGEK